MERQESCLIKRTRAQNHVLIRLWRVDLSSNKEEIKKNAHRDFRDSSPIKLEKPRLWQRILLFLRSNRDIGDPRAVSVYLDNRAAFLVQKAVIEYTRFRAGRHWSVLSQDDGFVDALERARWANYAIALDFVGEMALNSLRRKSKRPEQEIAGFLGRCTGTIMKSYADMTALPCEEWRTLTSASRYRLRTAALMGPRPVQEIPATRFSEFFENLPIHCKLGGHDELTLLNSMRVHLGQMNDEFRWRSDLPALDACMCAAASLRGEEPPSSS